MKKKAVCLVLFLSMAIISSGQNQGQFGDKISVSAKAPIKAYCFNLSDVRLLNSPFRDNMDRNGKWLMSLRTARLLHNYRVNAGLRTGAKAFGGWEGLDVEVRGHTLGHILSGLAMMYASTGEEAYRLKGDSLVAGLSECQKALGRNGYISAYPEYFIDRVIAGEPVWAPWYTIHKIYAGLLDMYLYTGNRLAFDMLLKAAAWADGKIGSFNNDHLQIMLKNEFGGMSEVFWNLYSVTGDPVHKKLAGCFYHNLVLDPLAEKTDKLKGLHANTQIPKIIGEARAYELTGNERSRTIAEFFWRTVIDNHTYANGGNSDGEQFFEPGKISEHFSFYNTETCNNYNMLKLTGHLFQWTVSTEYADYYEHALYNHILGSQDPETGMVCYLTAFVPGHFKVYSTPENSFWCCVGTGFENHAKYAGSIYFHDDRTLYVNLFIPSELAWRERNMFVRQETSFPGSDRITVFIESAPAEKMVVAVRYPSWAVSGATVKINGKNTRINALPGSYVMLDRQWKKGDKIEVTFPMKIRLIPANDNPSKSALAYGPVLLAGAMGTEGLNNSNQYGSNDNSMANVPVPQGVIHTLYPDMKDPSVSFSRVTGKPLTFITRPGAAAKEITLIPFYSLHHQRHVVYWDIE